MAIGTPTLLTSGQNNNSSPPTTATFSPTVGAVLFFFVAARGSVSGAAAPNLGINFSSGTWSATEYTVSDAATNKHTHSLFVAVVPSDISATVSITVTTDQAGNRWEWAVGQVTGAQLPAGDSITGSTTTASSSVTLGTSPAAGSVVIGGVASVAYNSSITPGAQFTTLVQTTSATSTALHVQYDATSPGTTVDWTTLGTTRNLMIAVEIEAVAAGSARVIRAKSSNTSDTVFTAEVSLGTSNLDRWFPLVAYEDTSGAIVGLKVGGFTADTEATTGTPKTQSGDLIWGNTAPSGNAADDIWTGTLINVDTLPTAAIESQLFDLLGDDMAPVVSDWSENIPANTSTVVGLSSRVSDPTGWGWTAVAVVQSGNCTAVVSGTSVTVTSLGSGTGVIQIVVTNLYPVPRSATGTLTVTMAAAATGLGRRLSGFSPSGNGGPVNPGAYGNQWGSMLTLDAALKNGRRSGVLVTFPGQTRPTDIINGGIDSALYSTCKANGVVPSMSLPLGFREKPNGASGYGDWAGITGGVYDSYYDDMLDALIAQGVDDIVFRIGWEMCNAANYAWDLKYDFVSPTSNSNFVNYKNAFNYVARKCKLAIPTCQIDWCSFKEPKLRYNNNANWYFPHPDEFYPGNTWVDIIGVDYYDDVSSRVTAANATTRMFGLKNDGTVATGIGVVNAVNPHGPGAWAAYAISKGKKFAVAEWGIRHTSVTDVGGDNLAFLDAMCGVFDTVASSLEYEAYFHRGGEFIQGETFLHPQTVTGSTAPKRRYIRYLGSPGPLGSGTGSTSATTGTYTPPASTGMLAFVAVKRTGGSPNKGTISGWTEVADVTQGEVRLTTWRQTSGASPTPTTLTATSTSATDTLLLVVSSPVAVATPLKSATAVSDVGAPVVTAAGSFASDNRALSACVVADTTPSPPLAYRTFDTLTRGTTRMVLAADNTSPGNSCAWTSTAGTDAAAVLLEIDTNE